MKQHTRRIHVTLMGIPMHFPEGGVRPEAAEPARDRRSERPADPSSRESERPGLPPATEPRVVIADRVVSPTDPSSSRTRVVALRQGLPFPRLLARSGLSATSRTLGGIGAVSAGVVSTLGTSLGLSASRGSRLGKETMAALAPLMVTRLARPFSAPRFSVRRALGLTLAAIAVVFTSASVALALT